MITVIGADRAGLVELLAGAIANHGGNWERSHLAELAGTFAGVVLVTVPDGGVDGLTAELEAVESTGLLHVSMTPAPAAAGSTGTNRLQLKLVGQDHIGIVHEISHALAARRVSIEELETAVVPAPMGGMLFEAEAMLAAPSDLPIDDVRIALEDLAQDLMVDLELIDHSEAGRTG